jgi:tubulin--tyrosine ligase
MNTSSLVLQPIIVEPVKRPVSKHKFSFSIENSKKLELLPPPPLPAFKPPKYSFKVEGINSFAFTKPHRMIDQSQSFIEQPKLPKPGTAAGNSKQIAHYSEDAKVTAFKTWCERISASNGLSMMQCDASSKYKYYLHKGNNSQLISSLMKQRSWWSRTEDPSQAQFLWTPLLKKSLFKSLEQVGVKSHSVQLTRPLLGKVHKECERLGYSAVLKAEHFSILASDVKDSRLIQTYNKLHRNLHLTTKKRLFLSLKLYCQAHSKDVFEIVPLTFCIKGLNDPEFSAFEASYRSKAAANEANVWIVKPGEFTNRGNGIKVLEDFSDVKAWVAQASKTCIVQEYLSKPLLINRRKFDIRVYAMLTSVNGRIQGYWYRQGYLRTSSKDFSLKSKSKYIHLTNDAVQKKAEDYGRFEAGNKVNSHPDVIH